MTTAAPSSTAAALAEIARLRAAGYDLVEPGLAELARLQRGLEVVSIRACEAPAGAQPAREVRYG